MILRPVTSIGSSNDDDLVLHNQEQCLNKVCPKHAVLCGDTLYDNGTTNGTWISSTNSDHAGKWVRMSTYKPEMLTPGQKICFAGNPGAIYASPFSNRMVFEYKVDAISSTCAICYDSPTRAVLTNCGHTYCSACLTNWLVYSGKETCPVCRDNLRKGNSSRR
jgi:hypothetical protein